VTGDILSEEYLQWMALIATASPNTPAFTKALDILNR
jgi:hypothetical protein